MIIPIQNCRLSMKAKVGMYEPHDTESVGVNGVEPDDECYASKNKREVEGGSIVLVDPVDSVRIEATCLADCPHCTGMSVER